MVVVNSQKIKVRSVVVEWRFYLAKHEQSIAAEQKRGRRKNARNPETVFAEITARLDEEAKKLGLTPSEYRELLEKGMPQITQSQSNEEIAKESARWLGGYHANLSRGVLLKRGK